MGLPAGDKAPLSELTQPILIGPVWAAAAPLAAGLAASLPDAAALAAGLALAAADPGALAAALGLAAALAGAGALDAGAAPPPQAARARQITAPRGLTNLNFIVSLLLGL